MANESRYTDEKSDIEDIFQILTGDIFTETEIVQMNCERINLELHKLNLQLELKVLKQRKPLIHARQENMHLNISVLEWRHKKLSEEIRILRTEMNEVFPAYIIKQEAKEDSEDIVEKNVSEEIISKENDSERINTKENITEESNNEQNNTDESHDQSGLGKLIIENVTTINDKNSNESKVKKTGDAVKFNRYFKGVNVKIVNFVLAKHGEDVIIETIKRITTQTAKTITDVNTEVLNVYLMNSKKITIHSIHSASLNKSLFISKRHYYIKWKRKPENHITTTVEPVVVDDDEEVKSATSLMFLKPSSSQHKVCELKKFRIGVLRGLTVDELFELVSENPFEIRPLNGDVVLPRSYMDLLQPIVIETLKRREINNDRGIPNISLLSSSEIKPHMKVVFKKSSQPTNKIHDDEVSTQCKNKSETLMTIDLTEKLIVPVKLSTTMHALYTDDSASISKHTTRITPSPLNESFDIYEISDAE